MGQENEVESIEFKWGKKRGVGGKKKDVQFYESFTYEGMEYRLFDSVYMYSEGEPEPFIGKIIKIWEGSDKAKKVKILWFFRPCEISNFLEGHPTSENELFLASGEGAGLANVNPLEAVAGKCNVVCISKDSRNPQPSAEELQMADFVFYRTFDVGRSVISDKIDNEIAIVDVKLLFNKVSIQKSNTVPEFHSNKEISKNELITDRTVVLPEDPSGECNTQKTNGSLVDVSAKQNTDSEVLMSEQKSMPGQKPSSPIGQESTKMVKDDYKKENFLGEKKTSRCEDDHVRDEIKVGNVPSIAAVKGDEKVKSTKDLGMGVRLSKKAQLDGSVEVYDENKKKSVQNLHCDSNTASGGKFKHRLSEDMHGNENISSKKPKLDDKLPKALKEASNDASKSANQILEVSRRPGVDKSRWFKGLPLEERIPNAQKEGRLVLLQNLDPSYTSAEVEDIVWHAFKEHCSAKIIQQIALSSPHSGQAIIILKTREAAENIVFKLDEGCLLLSKGRPLIGSIVNLSSPGKQSAFFGHISIDRLRLQMQREMKEAVSTSHCSQPNTVEYDMAMEWCLLQERTDLEWRRLYKQQGQELRKLQATLKSK